MASNNASDQSHLRLARFCDDFSSTRPEGWDEWFSDLCPDAVQLAGKSPAMLETLRTLQRIAQSACNPVLITGETGTGKEQAARAVHCWRLGEDQPFVAVNCAALTANLLESEMFGHVRGSFTGADRDKTGLFEAAGCGTIFLDEISETPLEIQAKLLRVIQERRFRMVGGTKDITCEATIIASSNRDLLAEVEAGRFRKDLYYRLAVFPVQMPELRNPNRRSDIPLLARYFLETSEIAQAGGVKDFTAAAEQFLLCHDWPGNVRELRNVIDRALILEDGKSIHPENIRIDRSNEAPATGDGTDTSKDFSLETAEREFILRALKETGWQRTRAASLLGITRATLHSKLKRYGLKPPGSESKSTKSSENPSSDETSEDSYQEACA